MTLTTRIAIINPVNPTDLHAFITGLVGGGPETSVERFPGEIHNDLGQGLAACVDVTYAIDGPLSDREIYEDDQRRYPAEYPEPFGSWSAWHCPVEHSVMVRLDTAYGFAEHFGVEVGCATLHRWLIEMIAAFCAARGAKDFVWYDEFRGQWYRGLDGLNAFDFFDSTQPGDEVRAALTAAYVAQADASV